MTDAPEPLSSPLTIGVEAYVSSEYARAESDKLWATVWQQVGRVEELPHVGSYLTYEINLARYVGTGEPRELS